jgi:hypothetical protein
MEFATRLPSHQEKCDPKWIDDQIVQLKFDNMASQDVEIDFAGDSYYGGIHIKDTFVIVISWSNLSTLGDAFSEDEVRNAINQMPSDKAPGPDGFTGIFFKKCWGIIKDDIMKVIEQFGNLHVHNFHWLNSTNIVLLPKKEGRRKLPTIDQ